MATEQEQLLQWYHTHQRDLPWRQTSDPYRIWLSEVMLQQTRVDTVIDYYHRFLERFPTVEDLAEAELDEVLGLWQGLGYYGRGRRIWQAAKRVVEEHEGRFPESMKAVRALPGIGPYTAGAIMSIAYNAPYPAVDGNVMRVISRYRGIDADIAQAKSRALFEKEVTRMLPEDRRHFNQALMELGAMVCKPQNPDCGTCPWRETCVAYREDRVGDLPVKTKKKKPVERAWAVLHLVNEQGEILFVRRPQEGLLADLWGLPIYPLEMMGDEEGLRARIREDLGIAIGPLRFVRQEKHIFTHRLWQMHRYDGAGDEEERVEDPEIKWVSESDLGEIALPTAFKKVLGDKK